MLATRAVQYRPGTHVSLPRLYTYPSLRYYNEYALFAAVYTPCARVQQQHYAYQTLTMYARIHVRLYRRSPLHLRRRRQRPLPPIACAFTMNVYSSCSQISQVLNAFSDFFFFLLFVYYYYYSAMRRCCNAMRLLRYFRVHASPRRNYIVIIQYIYIYRYNTLQRRQTADGISIDRELTKWRCAPEEWVGMSSWQKSIYIIHTPTVCSAQSAKSARVRIGFRAGRLNAKQFSKNHHRRHHLLVSVGTW